MMVIKEVSVGRTFSLGNYESLKVELVASVDPGEKVQKVMAELNEECKKYRIDVLR